MHSQYYFFLSINSLLILIISSTAQAKGTLHLQYDKLYPLYAQACALTKMTPSGTIFGHAVLYLKGMCRDETADSPRVKICDSEIDLKDPNSGTMITNLRKIKNAAWVAVQGADFAFDGGIDSQTPLTPVVYEDTIQKAIVQNIFKGVRLRARWERERQSKGLSQDRYLAESSLGTDFAISFARHSYCTYIPITQLQLLDMIQYLNRVNESFLYPSQKYHWNPVSNNCTHLVKNVLAAGGITSFIRTSRPFPISLNYAEFPSNLFLEMAEKGHPKDDFNIVEMFQNEATKNTLLRHGHPPFSHGTVAGILNANEIENQYFQPNYNLFVLDFSLNRKQEKTFYEMTKKDDFTSLVLNLNNSKKILTTSLSKLNSYSEIVEKNYKLNRSEFLEFYNKYQFWINAAILEVENNLQILERRD